MRQRLFGFLVAAMAILAVGWTVQKYGFSRHREWTTDSKAALAAFDAGLEARMRLYGGDAATNFRRALELDPGFVAAKVELAAVCRDADERKRLLEEIGAAKLDRLSERERFLVELALARGDGAKQKAIVAREMEVRSQDPWVVSVAAAEAWEDEDWERASTLYRQLIESDPNWISAHNNLGYMAMARGRFGEAEEHFRTYAFIAPDQANPHDSLGELLSLRGRYDEARAEAEQALREKPDFCSSYVTLLGIARFEGDAAAMPALVERAAKDCAQGVAKELECESMFYAAYRENDPDRPWRESFVDCAGTPGERGPFIHRLALLAGRDDEARAEERGAEARVAESGKSAYLAKARRGEMDLSHMRGVRALLEGHADEAVSDFLAADERSAYWNAGEGRFKLFNRMHLVLALERTNDRDGAARVLASVREVNEPFAALYPQVVGDLKGKR